MAEARRGFIRDNLVLVAAFALPAVVAVLFVIATAIPKWTVPLPQHDLVLRVEDYRQTRPADLAVEFVARDGRLEADVRRVPPPENPAMGTPYVQRWALLLFDHTANRVTEIPFDLPRELPAGEVRTVAIEALAGRYVTSDTVAPDGYQVTSLATGGSGGIVGELFGMGRRYRRGIAVSKNNRTVEVELPAPYRDTYGVITPIGWIR
jgi:hypothetical protein